MRDRFSIATATGALLGVFGLCCGLPLLLSAGVAGSIAGISIGSSLLIVLGVAALALAGWRRRERRYRACRCETTTWVSTRSLSETRGDDAL